MKIKYMLYKGKPVMEATHQALTDRVAFRLLEEDGTTSGPHELPSREFWELPSQWFTLTPTEGD